MKPHYSTALPSYYFGLEPATPARREEPTSRNALAAILTPSDVVLDVDASTKERALEEAARFLAGRHRLLEADVRTSLLEREKIGSTALGFGIAIPHARARGLSRPIAAFLRSRFPIPFGAPDDRLVSEMLVLLVPLQASDEHLQLLAEVAEMFSEKQLRERLRVQSDPARVHALLTTRGGA